MKANLVVSPKYKAVVRMVRMYGYDCDGVPVCGNSGCHSELVHLIDDWQAGLSDLRNEQAAHGLTDIQFEKLLATIYGADEIEFKDGGSDE